MGLAEREREMTPVFKDAVKKEEMRSMVVDGANG